MNKRSKKTLKIMSASCVFLSIFSYLPNTVFQDLVSTTSLLLLLFIISIPLSVLGFCFAMAIKSRVLVVANIIMFFSIPLVMYSMYIWEWMESV
ncbi:hypothetical protein DFP96_11230 [Listeria rocourtiae]|uniref:Uncharacterized protein n=1 Tax=Listeria rocourtiae TaxID=647910 RepID=A0A4R6ZHU1_9LIST|nr:hypothetical protein DFP96_11230 [Listeria rocourtiae]